MFYHCVAFVIDVMTVKEEVRRSFFHSKNYEDKKIDHFARRASALGSRVFSEEGIPTCERRSREWEVGIAFYPPNNKMLCYPGLLVGSRRVQQYDYAG